MSKTWREQVTEHGVTVTLYERVPGGPIHREVWVGEERSRKSLGRKAKDKDAAKEYAKTLCAEIAKRQLTGPISADPTLSEVFKVYMKEKGPLLSSRWKKAAEGRRDLFEEAWGPAFRAARLSWVQVQHFMVKRREGELGTRKVTDGTIEADLRWLNTVFAFAEDYKVDGDRPLISRNPLPAIRRKGGKKWPRPKNVRRPRANHTRYTKTLAVANQIEPTGALACMLALARFTGRRIGAICALRVTDFLRDQDAVLHRAAELGHEDAHGLAEVSQHGAIHWRAVEDKEGYRMVTPLSGPARKALDAYLARTPRVGELPLFPAPGKPAEPVRVDRAGEWLERAEAKAELPKQAGTRWHAYRRLWANERRELPAHDVADAGGWGSVEALQKVYQGAEAKTVRRVVDAFKTG